jgi:hypothetical protein
MEPQITQNTQMDIGGMRLDSGASLTVQLSGNS